MQLVDTNNGASVWKNGENGYLMLVHYYSTPYVLERLLLVSNTPGALLDEQVESLYVHAVHTGRPLTASLSGRSLRSLEVAQRQRVAPQTTERLWNYLILPIGKLTLSSHEGLEVRFQLRPVLEKADLEKHAVALDAEMDRAVTFDEQAAALYLKRSAEKPCRLWPLKLQVIADGELQLSKPLTPEEVAESDRRFGPRP